MRVSTCLLFVLGLGLATTTARTASGFCRSSTCREAPICDDIVDVDPTCKPLAWKRPCTGVSLQVKASEEVPWDIANAILTQAFAVWEEPVCDPETGGKPNIHVENMGPVACDLVQYNSKAANANVVMFRDGTWPHPMGPHNIALTTVTYDVRTGEIYDADMEINSAGDFGLTTGDTYVGTDLLSVLTHEAGHFLGLTHSADNTATMWANYTRGSIGQRTLALDDISAICASYPPVDPPLDKTTCNPIPRHGFSPACLSKQTEGNCSLSDRLGSKESSSSALVLAALALMAHVGRSRNRRVHPRS